MMNKPVIGDGPHGHNKIVEIHRAEQKLMAIPIALHIRCSGELEPWEYKGIEQYFRLVLAKIENGRREYGMDYLARSDASFIENINEELADLAGWGAMRHVKLNRPIQAPS